MARELLMEGKSIAEIFPLTDGQDCLTYKGKWPEDLSSDEIIYIPDTSLNCLDDPEMPIEEKVSYMYTAADFLAQTNMNAAAAKELFNYDDWQNPNIQDLLEAYDEDEARDYFGETWDEMFARKGMMDPKTM